MTLNSKVYDQLKWVVQILLPACGVLYAGLSDWWNLPKPLEIVGTISLVSVFIGTILGLSSANYKAHNEPNAGYILDNGVDEDTGMPNLGMTLNVHPDDLLNKDTVTLHVKKP